MTHDAQLASWADRVVFLRDGRVVDQTAPPAGTGVAARLRPAVMTASVRGRPPMTAVGNGGAPARRAVVRWAWRLYRREWRRQALVLALLIVAIAATMVGLGVVSNAAALKADPTFGTANTILTLHGHRRRPQR